MSDEFDKEAEREKLREKYERDREKREHTQHMSELLLKGATMTNRHCDTCGDPIFRHDGREFCPTCARDDAAAEPEDGTARDSAARGSTANAQNARDEAAADAATGIGIDHDGVDAESANANTDANTNTNANTNANANEVDRAGPAGTTAGGANETPTATRANRSDVRSATDRAPVDDRSGSTPSEDLRAAHESLTRTVRRFAEAAEGANDPKRAREHLEAAREAAEALAALDR